MPLVEMSEWVGGLDHEATRHAGRTAGGFIQDVSLVVAAGAGLVSGRSTVLPWMRSGRMKAKAVAAANMAVALEVR